MNTEYPGSDYLDERLKLTRDQFVDAYVIDFNLSATARRCGIDRSYANRLIRIPAVWEAIKQTVEDRRKSFNIEATEVLAELRTLAFSNMSDFIDDEGRVDLSSLSDEQKSCIQEIISETYEEGRGEDKREVKKVKLKLYDRKGALELLGKYLMLFNTDRVEHTGKDGGPIENKITLEFVEPEKQ